MKHNLLRPFAWALAFITLAALLTSAILVILNPAGQDERYLEILSGAIIGCGAPVLGLVIIRSQPRNRIGWLWMVVGLSVAFFSISYALKYQAKVSSFMGYSDPLFVMLIFSETANIVRLISMILLMLWFPDGQPPSPRWRFMHWWVVVALIFLTLGLFAVRVPWSEVDGLVGGIPTVDNPIGFLPESLGPVFNALAPIGFFSILIMFVLSVVSIILRYRRSSTLVQVQIRWFVLGSVFYALTFIVGIFLLDYLGQWAGLIGNLAIIPFYLAIGIAITRYRLYDIDLIIRKTLQYALVTVLMGLVYFGSVTVLQAISSAVFGFQSPVIIVISTLLIAALFNPLRIRIQSVIDRRFYRRRYNAEKALADFATAIRNETEIECITQELIDLIQETMQPENITIQLKGSGRER